MAGPKTLESRVSFAVREELELFLVTNPEAVVAILDYLLRLNLNIYEKTLVGRANAALRNAKVDLQGYYWDEISEAIWEILAPGSDTHGYTRLNELVKFLNEQLRQASQSR